MINTPKHGNFFFLLHVIVPYMQWRGKAMQPDVMKYHIFNTLSHVVPDN